MEQVVFYKTYVEAKAPGRMPNMGVTLLGPTLLAFGTDEQQRRFVPPILAGEEFWCQGYSEPNAGSDLANIATQSPAQRRPLGHQRPESVDFAGAVLRLVLRGVPHRRRHRTPPGAILPAGADGTARRGNPPDRADHRRH